MTKTIISTKQAPQAVGTYSQAVKAGNTVYLSGQIPLIPETGLLCEGGIQAQIKQVFENLKAVAEAAGGSFKDFVKVTVYLVDLSHFPHVNEIMAQYFTEPYPARVTIGISALPKGSLVEIEGIMVLG